MQLFRESADLIAADEGDVVVVQLAQLGQVREVSDDGRVSYREAFNSVQLEPKVKVWNQHHDQVIGHADVSSFRDAPQPTVDLHVADTTAGRDLMALIRNDTINDVSVEFSPSPRDHVVNGVMQRDALVAGIAFSFKPAHTAPILSMRDQPTGDKMDTTTTSDTDTDTLTRDDLEEMGNTLKRDIIAGLPADFAAGPGDEFADLRKYRSLTDATLASREDPEVGQLLTRALVDQITDNNAGVVPPAWLSTVQGIISRGRPTISAFGTGPLDAAGMEVDWPFYDGDFTALVAEQVTEKTEIESVLVNIEKGSAPLKTYAGGSDISLPLLRRSSPSYRASYDQIMMVGYAATSDAAANAAALAAATAGTVWVPATGTAAELKDSLFRASVAVQAATGAPATFAVVASDVFISIGVLDGLNPLPYGVQNTPGTADAASLAVNVSGLPIVHDPYAANGSFIVSNDLAGSWFEDGPMSIESADVAKLGLDVAVWGLGAFGSLLPAGIISIAAA